METFAKSVGWRAGSAPPFLRFLFLVLLLVTHGLLFGSEPQADEVQNSNLAALPQFAEAVHLEPKSAAAHYRQGRALNDLDRREAAREALATACQLQRDYPAAL